MEYKRLDYLLLNGDHWFGSLKVSRDHAVQAVTSLHKKIIIERENVGN